MSFISLLVVLITLVGFLLVLIIMVQEGKGGGLSSSAFGGSDQMIGGVKETGNFLTKFTWTMAISFAFLILMGNVILKSDRNIEHETTVESDE